MGSDVLDHELRDHANKDTVVEQVEVEDNLTKLKRNLVRRDPTLIPTLVHLYLTRARHSGWESSSVCWCLIISLRGWEEYISSLS